jgi:hypothetical protein
VTYYYDHKEEYDAKDADLEALMRQDRAESEIRLARIRARYKSILHERYPEIDLFERDEKVVLTSDLPEEQLKAGDIGTVRFVDAEGPTYRVEFASLDGRTVKFVMVSVDQLRRVREGEIAHARPIG